jgi:hypothetical protein
MAGEGVERGSAELSRSTRRDITWPINTGCTITTHQDLEAADAAGQLLIPSTVS